MGKPFELVCKQGHTRTAANTFFTPDGVKCCRICTRLRRNIRMRALRKQVRHSEWKFIRKIDLEKFFWPKVHKTETCWLWTKVKNHLGYGLSHIKGVTVGAHRIAWQAANRRNVPRGMYVCHHCDVPACVNPAHLFLGTPHQNMEDMRAKGRQPRLTRRTNGRFIPYREATQS